MCANSEGSVETVSSEPLLLYQNHIIELVASKAYLTAVTTLTPWQRAGFFFVVFLQHTCAEYDKKQYVAMYGTPMRHSDSCCFLNAQRTGRIRLHG